MHGLRIYVCHLYLDQEVNFLKAVDIDDHLDNSYNRSFLKYYRLKG